MKNTRLLFLPSRRILRAGSVPAIAVLAAIGVWAMLWGCADRRNEPLTPASDAFTQTIDLWNNTPTDAGGTVSASFTVDGPLSPITVPGVDTPARLRVSVSFPPDCQIYRRLQIIQDSIPYIRDSLIIGSLVELTNFKADHLTLDSVQTAQLNRFEGVLRTVVQTLPVELSLTDSLTDFTYRGRAVHCDSALYRSEISFTDTARIDSIIASAASGFAALNDTLSQLEIQLFQLQADTARLGREAFLLGQIADARYEVSIALDSTNQFIFPNAAYEIDGAVRGQGLYAAALDTTRNVIGAGMLLFFDRLEAADITHPEHQIQVNWTVCFAGSDRPCLSPGPHTIYVHIAGRNALVTGTIVLVYAERA